MKLPGYRETFYVYSGKASDICRQLAFAGIAVIWLFKKDVVGQPTLPIELIWSGVFIVLSLVADVFQYVLASIVWRLFYRAKEKAGVSEEQELEHSIWLERPI